MANLLGNTTIGGHQAIHVGNVSAYAGITQAFADGRYLLIAGGTLTGQLNTAATSSGGDHGIRVGAVRGSAFGSQTGDYIMLYERVHIGYPSGWGAASASAPSYGLGVWGNIHVSQSGGTGGGIILADDGDIVDLNDAYASMRFSSGVRIYSANRGGSPVITLGSNGVVTANASVNAPIFYDSNDTNYYIDPNSTSVVLNINSQGYVGANTSQTRDKLRVWNSNEYTIGMKSGYDYGHLTNGEYAMSFQMNDNNNRGFWWGDTAHNDDQGAASLTTDGRMVIAKSLSIGEGEAILSPSSTPLYVKGSTQGSDVFAVDGINGRLFTVTDDLSDSLFSVNTIAGLPIIEAFADNTVKIGKYGSNSITISNSKIAINSDTVDANFPFYVGDRSTAGARYILANPGMGFNLADNYAQLQLYGGSGGYIDFVSSAIDSGGRIFWNGSFTISGDTYFNNSLYTYTLYDRNDTGYYLDMNGTSRLGTINVNQITVYGSSYLGDGNGDETHINDTLRVGATDSGDAHFYFGEGGSAGSDYGSHWYWDSAYTFNWYTRNAGSDTLLFNYLTNDTSYVNWHRNFHMQNKAIDYISQLYFNAGSRFYGNDTHYLNFRPEATDYGSIHVRDGNATLRGYLGYFDSSGFGLLNSGGSWGIRLNPGNAETLLYYAGDWKIRTGSNGVGINGNVYIDQNYGHGVVGLYSASRYQGVFAMGSSYMLPADGTSTGSLYGLAWSHPNAGGVASNLNTHGLLVMENGTFLAAVSGSIRARDDMRAPIFYDSNDTNYYINPNDYSRLWRTSMHWAPSPGVGSSNWVNDFNATPVSSMSFGGDLSSGGPQGTWWFQQNMRHSNTSNYWGTQIAWGWEDNANELWQRNVQGGSWSSWVRYINTNNYAGILDSRYYTESEVNSLLSAKQDASTAITTSNIGSQSVNYASSAGNADTVDSLHASDFVRAYTTSAGNIDADWGQSFKTFDPVPSGTPPLDSPNIRTVNIGEDFNRRTQLAFDYASDVAYFRRRDDGGWRTWREFIHSGNIGSQSVNYAATAGSAPANGGNSSTVGGLSVHSGRNNEANKIVRTDANGYIQAGWINTPSGAFNSAITKIYCSDDDYVRYQTAANFISNLGLISNSNIGSQSVNYATTAGSADQIDGVGFRNTGSNAGTNADTIESNGITYYTAGVANFSGNATDGALYSQAYSSAWQHQIAGDYRSGMIAVRGKNNGTWQEWKTVIDSSTIGSQSVSYASSAGNADTVDGYHATAFPYRSSGSSGYYQVADWMQFNTTAGIYWPSYNGAHIYPNTSTSYGSIRVDGSRSSWRGITFDGAVTLMMNNQESGHYRDGSGWQFRWYQGQMYTSRGTDGGSTEYRMLDAGNYTEWAIARGGDTVSGIIYYLTNNGGRLSNTSSAALQAYSTGNNAAFMSFHKSGVFAINFGLDDDNVMRMGGWSASADLFQMDMSGNLTMKGDVIAFSDERVKTNIQTLEGALDKVLKLRGVSYNRTDTDDKSAKIGVIAQEILAVVPEVVSQDANGTYGVAYGNVVGLLIEAIKEQQSQINELKKRLGE